MLNTALGRPQDISPVTDFALPIIKEMGETSNYTLVSHTLRRYMDHPRDCLWLVSRVDGEVVGSLLAQVRGGGLVDRRDVFIDAVAVRKDHRGQHIARDLLAAAEQWGITKAVRSLILTLPGAPLCEAHDALVGVGGGYTFNITDGVAIAPRPQYVELERWYRKDLNHGISERPSRAAAA